MLASSAAMTLLATAASSEQLLRVPCTHCLVRTLQDRGITFFTEIPRWESQSGRGRSKWLLDLRHSIWSETIERRVASVQQEYIRNKHR